MASRFEPDARTWILTDDTGATDADVYPVTILVPRDPSIVYIDILYIKLISKSSRTSG